MVQNTECIFCKMVAGQIPITRIYEDEYTLSFLDIGPVSDGHTLVMPKHHYESLHQCPPEIIQNVSSAFAKIAKAVIAAMDAEGYNLLCNNGRAAGQLVNHLHFHIIPRRSGDGVLAGWPCYKYPEGKIERIAEKIRNNL